MAIYLVSVASLTTVRYEEVEVEADSAEAAAKLVRARIDDNEDHAARNTFFERAETDFDCVIGDYVTAWSQGEDGRGGDQLYQCYDGWTAQAYSADKLYRALVAALNAMEADAADRKYCSHCGWAAGDDTGHERDCPITRAENAIEAADALNVDLGPGAEPVTIAEAAGQAIAEARAVAAVPVVIAAPAGDHLASVIKAWYIADGGKREFAYLQRFDGNIEDPEYTANIDEAYRVDYLKAGTLALLLALLHSLDDGEYEAVRVTDDAAAATISVLATVGTLGAGGVS